MLANTIINFHQIWLMTFKIMKFKNVEYGLSCAYYLTLLPGVVLFCCYVMYISSWPMSCSTPGFPVLYYFPEFAQIHVHWVSDAIQTYYPLSLTSLLAHNLSQHRGLFQWVDSSHQVAKVLELQLQHQSFQWIFRVYFL